MTQMKTSYFDLIDQSYGFPQDGFDLQDGHLTFHGISLKQLIDEHGTPFKLLYLPKIGEQIGLAKDLFDRAIKKNDYHGKYEYSYCTKCCHFSEVVTTAIREGAHLETSSSFDIDIIYRLLENGKVNKSIIIVHNGYKTEDYLQKIIQLNRDGFTNSILVLDSRAEVHRVKHLTRAAEQKIKVGIRMAIDEEPQSSYHTSRLGIRPSQVIQCYEEDIAKDDYLSLQMMHFFVDSGIKDNLYYWGEFKKALNLFVQLKELAKDMKAINIGGGFPVKDHLGFDYDYEYIIDEIVKNIQVACQDAKVMEPDIFTEFGKFTVGESGAVVFSVVEQKHQNDSELWYIVNNSLLNTIPDAWLMLEKFILLPINNWHAEYRRVNIGGISCDHSDYYNSEQMNQQIYLPAYNAGDGPLYIGFFHTGAYQDAVSGYGGIKHCLIPSPKTIIIDRDMGGDCVSQVHDNGHSVDEMLQILGYNDDGNRM